MKRLLLVRLREIDDGTFGHLLCGDLCLATCEPEAPRIGNKGRVPPGLYRAYWDDTGSHHGYKLVAVPGYKDIELHIGNTEDDSAGCILPGLTRGKLYGKEAVLQSGAALLQLHNLLDQEPFELEIIERFE